MTKKLETYYEVVMSFKHFKPFFPDHVLKEMAEGLALEIVGEVREVAE